MAFEKADSLRFMNHFDNIISEDSYRNYLNTDELDAVAAYIQSEFEKHSDNVTLQPYQADERNYSNVIASFGPDDAKRIIIGAHYDVCGEQNGADDNASGIVGLLELARLLQNKTLKYRIDLVAYSLEEPPYFRSKFMGSYIHAKYLHDNNIPVYGMVSLDMIGFFNDEPGSQSYPLGMMSWFYGDTANFIGLVTKLFPGSFANNFIKNFGKQNLIPTQSITAPKLVQGIDFSDHLNYWKFGYSALMITDTAFMRNPNYHNETDTVDTLDFRRMFAVIHSISNTLFDMAG